MATIKNQWIAANIGTITPDYIESLLAKGASNDFIAATAGVSPARLASLLGQAVPAGFNGIPNASGTYLDNLPGAPRLANSSL